MTPRSEEGPFDTVGWGPFALRGERKRLREAEIARRAELEKVSPTVSVGQRELTSGIQRAPALERTAATIGFPHTPQEVADHMGDLLKWYRGNPGFIDREDSIVHIIPPIQVEEDAQRPYEYTAGISVAGTTLYILDGEGRAIQAEVDQQVAETLSSRPDLLSDPIVALITALRDISAHSSRF